MGNSCGINLGVRNGAICESTQNQFRWKAWWCVENYFKLEDPTSFEAKGIEEKVSGDIGVPIFGIIDRWSLEDDKLVISDYKTGKKPRPRYEWEKQMQIILLNSTGADDYL